MARKVVLKDGTKISQDQWRGQVIEKLNYLTEFSGKLEGDLKSIHEHCQEHDRQIRDLEHFAEEVPQRHKALKTEIKDEIKKEEIEEKQRLVNWITAAIGIIFTVIQVVLKYLP